MTAVGPGADGLRPARRRRAAARQPVDEQRAAQHLPRPATAPGSPSRPAPSDRRAGPAPGRPPRGDRRAVVRQRPRPGRSTPTCSTATSATGSPSGPAPRCSTRSTEAGAAVAPVYDAARHRRGPARAGDRDAHRRSTTTTSGRCCMHNVMWRMSRHPGPDPLHRPRARRRHRRRAGRARPATRRTELAEASRDRETRQADPMTRRRCWTPCAGGVQVYDLGRPARASACRSRPTTRRSGTPCRAATATWCGADGGSAANDLIAMGTHVGTHIDALAHVSHDGRLHGGADAAEAGVGGRYVELGVHTIAPMVRRGVLLDVAGALGRRALRAPATRSPPATSRRPRARAGHRTSARATSCWSAAAGAAASPRAPPYVGTRAPGCPGVGEAGARWLADARGRTRPAPTPSPSSGSRPAAGTRVLPAHRVLLVERGIYIIEALELEELAAARRPRVHLRAGAAATSSAPPARRCARSRWCRVREPSATAGRSSWARSPPARRTTTLPADVVDSVAQAGARHPRPRASPRPPLATSRGRARAGSREQGGAPQATAVGLPDRLPAAAGGVRQRRAGALARLRRHPPAVGAAPERHASCRPRWRPPRRPAPTGAELVAAVAVGLEVCVRLGMAGYDEDRRQLASSSSTASTRPRSAARWAPRSPRRCCRAGRRRRRRTRSASPRRWPSGIIEANRTGGTVKRMHCGWAAHAGGHRRRLVAPRLHRPADRARGPVRLLPGVAARRVRRRRGRPTGSATKWAVPGIFFKPYPANHFTHAAIDAAAALRAPRRRPRRDRATACSASPPPTCAPSASRSRSSARRRPATWRSSAGRTPSRRPARRRRARAASTTSPTSWRATRAAAALMAKRRRRRRRRAAPRSSRTSSRPCSRVAAARRHASWSRRCSPPAAGPSGRCRFDELATKFRDNAARGC